MALNRDAGEVVEGLGHMFRVVPTDKWATTEFGAPHFMEAHEKATAAFKQSIGKFCNPGEHIKLGRENVLVQEYPLLNKVAFIFELKLAGMDKEHVYPYVFDLDPRLVEALRLAGEWQSIGSVH